MKHFTYKKLYQAALGAVDKIALSQIKNEESDPFYQNLIDLILRQDSFLIHWDVKPFTTEFISNYPRQRLDETFFAFVLRIVDIIKEEVYFRTYQKPETFHVVYAWLSILEDVICCSLALLYNVRWTQELHFTHLKPTIMKLFVDGDAFALRQLMIDLGITFQQEIYPAEKMFGKLHYLNISQFGSFFWRYLHWMAEAVALRDKDMAFYKNQWLELLKGPIYRTLRCKLCMIHFKTMLEERKEKLVEKDSIAIPRLFFEMHNKTHGFRRETFQFLQEADYSDTQYEVDSEFMRQALLVK